MSDFAAWPMTFVVLVCLKQVAPAQVTGRHRETALKSGSCSANQSKASFRRKEMDHRLLFRTAIHAFTALYLIVPFAVGETRTSTPELRLIPQPRELETTANSFRLVPGSRIQVLSSDKEDHLTAELLAQELKEVTGEKHLVASGGAARVSSDILLGRLADVRVQSLLRSDKLKTDDICAEGYVLEVTPNRILVAGKDGAGLFYGVETLRQLIKLDSLTR
jgi:hypothetical protein